MSCEGDLIPGTQITTLGLQTRIGRARPLADIISHPWPSPYFGRVGFGNFENVEFINEGGVFYQVPRQGIADRSSGTGYRHVWWVDTGWFSDEGFGPDDIPPENGYSFIDLTGEALYWLIQPTVNVDNIIPVIGGLGRPWIYNWQIYDFGGIWYDNFTWFYGELVWDGAFASDASIFLGINDDEGGVDYEAEYDWTKPIWIRLRHNAETDEVAWDTAVPGEGCPLEWTERLSMIVNLPVWADDPPPHGIVSQMTMEFTGDVSSLVGGDIPNPGFIGPLNPTPREASLPLLTTINPPPLVPGPITTTLPLTTEVNAGSGDV